MPTASPRFIEGFTSEIPYYMHLSDFFIGKPGPGSISEALAMKLPVIVESNAWTLPQERYNTEWVREHGVGVVLPNFRGISAPVSELLGSLDEYRARVGENRKSRGVRNPGHPGAYTVNVKLLFFLLALAASVCAQPERIILDTDCAVFNDDGAAMVMLLERPQQADVIAVTLVPGNMWPFAGAEYMFRTLDAMKRTGVVLYAGAQAPLLHNRAMAHKEASEWGEGYLGALGEDPPEKTKSAGRVSRRSAVDVMIEAIDKTPGEVTIVEIGPHDESGHRAAPAAGS